MSERFGLSSMAEIYRMQTRSGDLIELPKDFFQNCKSAISDYNDAYEIALNERKAEEAMDALNLSRKSDTMVRNIRSMRVKCIADSVYKEVFLGGKAPMNMTDEERTFYSDLSKLYSEFRENYIYKF